MCQGWYTDRQSRSESTEVDPCANGHPIFGRVIMTIPCGKKSSLKQMSVGQTATYKRTLHFMQKYHKQEQTPEWKG